VYAGVRDMQLERVCHLWLQERQCDCLCIAIVKLRTACLWQDGRRHRPWCMAAAYLQRAAIEQHGALIPTLRQSVNQTCLQRGLAIKQLHCSWQNADGAACYGLIHAQLEDC
jgi:hypothetical protein